MTPVAMLDVAVVDSSALMSIFDKRNSARAFIEGLKRSQTLLMSAPTLLELSLVFIGKKAVGGLSPLDEMIDRFQIQIVPFDLALVHVGRQGCANYGRGHHKASLNFGDLFSYAMAKSNNLPLYFEGLDFPQTDIRDAMALLGYSFDTKHSPIPVSKPPLHPSVP